jgi:hypothetical protein
VLTDRAVADLAGRHGWPLSKIDFSKFIIASELRIINDYQRFDGKIYVLNDFLHCFLVIVTSKKETKKGKPFRETVFEKRFSGSF